MRLAILAALSKEGEEAYQRILDDVFAERDDVKETDLKDLHMETR